MKNLNKGYYGHLKRYKEIRLILIFACFLFILADVLFSLIIFQTRKTLFIVVAAILSIPFAKNFVLYLLCLKCKSLTAEEYKETELISERTEKSLLYDISVTGDSVTFFPVAAIYNNSLILYCPDIPEKEAKRYIEDIYSGSKLSPRIVITKDFMRFEKELIKLPEAKEKQEKIDTLIGDRLLEAGF